ncbi:MAG: MFS transporter [Syntrophales bacterium]
MASFTEQIKKNSAPDTRAFLFVVLVGAVSLFADMTYEGARSITGPFLGSLGATATIVGITAGMGELAGYGVRLVSGYLTDRTGQYWTITIVGYVINLLAVPALALTDRWDLAAALVIAERLGKGVRTPARDTMLSHATRKIGRGRGFGLHEALDQVGAVLGPLIVAMVLSLTGDYKYSFAVLLVPALFAVAILLAARLLYPSPRDMEKTLQKTTGRFPRIFWLYLSGIAFIAAGFADYSLIAYHFGKIASVPKDWIPIFYSAAMGIDALTALIFGYFFDRIGFRILIWGTVISSLFAPFVFFGGFWLALFGVALWGIGMGAQESIMRAAVAEMISSEKRGTAYGIFNSGYGFAWFLGSTLMGYLYDLSVTALVVFSITAQLLSIPVLIIVNRKWPAG